MHKSLALSYRIIFAWQDIIFYGGDNAFHCKRVPGNVYGINALHPTAEGDGAGKEIATSLRSSQ